MFEYVLKKADHKTEVQLVGSSFKNTKTKEYSPL